MRCLSLLFLAALASCGAGQAVPRGAWPSLAKRPVEAASAGVPTAAPDAGTVKGSDAGPGRDVGTGRSTPADDDTAARLAIAARDLDQLEQRWQLQRTATQRASAAVRVRPGAEADAAVQLETGRLDRLAGQVADERTRLEAITGDLAVAASAGSDVSQPLRTAGLLIVRCAKLTTDATPDAKPRDGARTAPPR